MRWYSENLIRQFLIDHTKATKEETSIILDHIPYVTGLQAFAIELEDVYPDHEKGRHKISISVDNRELS